MTMMSKKELYNSNFKTHLSASLLASFLFFGRAKQCPRLFSLSLSASFFARLLSLSRGFGVFFGRSVSRALRDGTRETDFDAF